ncbi:Salicylate hydroxylase 3 [Seiridium cupressi]
MAPSKDFQVAIIGGGIAGLTLAIALHYRNIPIMLYESAAHFAEIGAGVSFSPNAVQAMKAIHPSVYEAFERVCTRNCWESKRYTWFDYVDGTEGNDKDVAFTIRTSQGQNAVHRAHYLDELVKLLPAEKAQFGKRLQEVKEDGDGKLVMSFQDGSTATADAVIGCDGIKSKVRRMIVGADHPSAHPSYTHKYAYRGLVPMDVAVETIGDERAKNSYVFMGQDGHVLTFPVAGGKQLNIVAFRTTKDDWPDYSKLTRPAKRDDALRDFKGHGDNVTKLLKLTNENLDVWAIFDTGSTPVPTFYKGRICVTGDAAHATSPHHGAGAGFCIEDSFVMADLLADERVQKSSDLESVFAAFDKTRRERSHWLVQSSRFIGDCYEWRADGVGKDFKKIEAEINQRVSIIADVDVHKLAGAAKDDLHARLSE